MRAINSSPMALSAIALLAIASAVSAQPVPVEEATNEGVLVTATAPTDLSGYPEGPEIEGLISAREGNKVEVTLNDGTKQVVTISAGTKIRASGGFLGLARDQLGLEQLLNGVPVKVETVSWNNGLVASDVRLKARDLRTAQIVQSGTAQQFGEQGAKIGENKLATERNEAATQRNAAAAEALRGRFDDIDKYNVKATTNVFFDTGKYSLSAAARGDLCEAAQAADALDNALILVVGYTDSTGSYEVNQRLSERRAGRVVNHLQQQCGWKPWRMLAPSGFADADPTADNSTAEGRAQNRRVAVNVLVSKSVDGQ